MAFPERAYQFARRRIAALRNAYDGGKRHGQSSARTPHYEGVLVLAFS